MKKILFALICLACLVVVATTCKTEILNAVKKTSAPQGKQPEEIQSESMLKYEKSGMPKFIMGACTHFWQGKGILEKNVDMLLQAGFNSIRDEATWSSVEKQKGVLSMPPHAEKYLSYASSKNLNPLLILDYANIFYNGGGYPETPEAIDGFANYAGFMAKNLKGKVKLYQVWNEWDGGCGMPGFKGKSTAPGYAKLLEKVYAAIKAEDSEALVLLNSICKGDSFFEESLATGVLKNCDVATLHTYNYGEQRTFNTAEAWYARMQNIENMLKKYNDGQLKPLIITEMGYPNQTSNAGSTYERTAIQAAKIYLLARTLPWLKGIYWYDFQDDGWDSDYNENNFGIIKADFTPKPAYYALKSISDIVKNADFEGFEKTPVSSLKILKFKLRGKDVYALWNIDENTEIQVTLKNSAEVKTDIEAFTAGGISQKRQWGRRDFLKDRNVKSETDTITFCVGMMPLILKGDFSNVKILSTKPVAYNALHTQKQLPRIMYSVPRTPFESDAQDFSYNTILPWQPVKEVFSGKDDLSANFKASYQPDALNFTISVVDQTHFVNSKKPELSDYAQIFLKIPEPHAQSLSATVLLDNGEVKILCDSDKFSRDKSLIKSEATRDQNTTIYKISLSPKLFGLKSFERGMAIGCGILVNDNDNENEPLSNQPMLRWSNAPGRNSTDTSKLNALILD